MGANLPSLLAPGTRHHQMTKQTDSDYPQPEAEQRRDDLLRTLLKTPPSQRPKREREAKPTEATVKGKQGLQNPKS